MAAVDVNHSGEKTILLEAVSGGSNPLAYEALDGVTGSRLWQVPYPAGTSLLGDCRFADVNGDGTLDVAACRQ